MKYCNQCGAPLARGARFCGQCGSPVGGAGLKVGDKPTKEEVKAETSPAKVGENATYRDKYSNYGKESSGEYRKETTGGYRKDNSREYHPEMIDFSAKKKKRSHSPLILIFLVIIALAAGGVYFFLIRGFGKPTINLTDYLMIEYEGYDGDGEIARDYPRIDRDALSDAMRAKAENFSGSAGSILDHVKIEVYRGDSLTDGKHLNNQEELTIKLNYDSKQLRIICPEINFVGDTKKVRVNLMVLTGIDPFENFHPEFKGISPAGHLRTDMDAYSDVENTIVSKCYAEYRTLPFDVSLDGRVMKDDDYVAVGDVIELILNENGKATMQEMGLTAKDGADSSSYTVTLADFDAGEYMTEPAELDPAVLQELTDRAAHEAKAFAAERGYNSDPEYVGRTYTKLKEGADLDQYIPSIYFVYKIKTNYSESEDKEDYILITHGELIRQVENHGKKTVYEDPGTEIQTFNKDTNSFNQYLEDDIEDLNREFSERLSIRDYTMDEAVETLMNWAD